MEEARKGKQNGACDWIIGGERKLPNYLAGASLLWRGFGRCWSGERGISRVIFPLERKKWATPGFIDLNCFAIMGKNHRMIKFFSKPVVAIACGILFLASLPALGIPITSSNGKTVDFAGVKSASPAGLEVQVTKDAPPLTLPWSRLDLKKLETENPQIHEARKKTLEGTVVELNLGSFAPEKPMEAKPTDRTGRLEAEGIYEKSVKGGADDNFSSLKLALKVPGGKAKGIFLFVTGAAIKSPDGAGKFVAGIFDTTSTAIAKQGPWFPYGAQQGLAIAGLEVDGNGAKKGAAPYHEVSKGIGDALLRAIDMVADGAKREELKTVPLIMYGRDVGGGAFVYNLAQWKPERIAAAVVAKGAFYDAEPTEASAKVPLMFVQGEYDNDWELFGGKNLANEVVEKYANLKPNWTYALEPRGTSGDSLQVYTIVQAFLDRVTPMRIGGVGLTEIDRSSSWVGDIKAKTASQAGGGTEWTADKTWLPDAQFAKSWEGFVNGTLEPKIPGQ
jgi:hypothetical protein